MNEEQNKIVVFQEKQIRRVWHNEEWWFTIVDVVEVLTDSKNPSGYIKDMRRRDAELAKGWGQIATPLLVETAGGKQKLNCANTQGIFRIIQSIPSPKAEPFKLWLAQVGYERIQSKSRRCQKRNIKASVLPKNQQQLLQSLPPTATSLPRHSLG